MATGKRNMTIELRRRIIQAYKNGRTSAEIAANFNCHRATIDRIIKAFVSEDKIKTKHVGGNRKKN
jgi:IS30 family transposase